MTVKGLHHFNLRVPVEELEMLVRFYTQVLGFAEGSRPDFVSRGSWLYADGIPLLHLTEMNSGETVALGALSELQPIDERISAVDHVALRCTDLDLFVERLSRHAVPFLRTEVPALREVQLFLRDPSGSGIELIFAMDEKA